MALAARPTLLPIPAHLLDLRAWVIGVPWFGVGPRPGDVAPAQVPSVPPRGLRPSPL